MRKVFLVLLIVLVGLGVFFYPRVKKIYSQVNEIRIELNQEVETLKALQNQLVVKENIIRDMEAKLNDLRKRNVFKEYGAGLEKYNKEVAEYKVTVEKYKVHEQKYKDLTAMLQNKMNSLGKKFKLKK